MHETTYVWVIGFWVSVLLLGLIEFWSDSGSFSRQRRNRWWVNFGFGILNSLLASSIPISIVLVSQWAHSHKFGLFNWIELPVILIVLATVLIRSFSQYVFHRALHIVPSLWPIHKVHHTDSFCGVSTGLRFHPLELIANIFIISLVSIMLGFDAETLIIYESIILFFNIIVHVSVSLPLSVEKVLRIFFITPQLHRIHHSNDRREYESNFSVDFSIWDRLFGTFLSSPVRETGDGYFGVKNYDPRLSNSIDEQIILPIKDWGR